LEEDVLSDSYLVENRELSSPKITWESQVAQLRCRVEVLEEENKALQIQIDKLQVGEEVKGQLESLLDKSEVKNKAKALLVESFWHFPYLGNKDIPKIQLIYMKKWPKEENNVHLFTSTFISNLKYYWNEERRRQIAAFVRVLQPNDQIEQRTGSEEELEQSTWKAEETKWTDHIEKDEALQMAGALVNKTNNLSFNRSNPHHTINALAWTLHVIRLTRMVKADTTVVRAKNASFKSLFLDAQRVLYTRVQKQTAGAQAARKVASSEGQRRVSSPKTKEPMVVNRPGTPLTRTAETPLTRTAETPVSRSTPHAPKRAPQLQTRAVPPTATPIPKIPERPSPGNVETAKTMATVSKETETETEKETETETAVSTKPAVSKAPETKTGRNTQARPVPKLQTRAVPPTATSPLPSQDTEKETEKETETETAVSTQTAVSKDMSSPSSPSASPAYANSKFWKYTVPELKRLCSENNMIAKGNKSALVQKLEDLSKKRNAAGTLQDFFAAPAQKKPKPKTTPTTNNNNKRNKAN